jgi:single-strand DNA-binding protein
MLNTIVIQGRLAADCEVKNTPNGALVTNFAVAVQRNFKNNVGQYDTDFIDCVSFEKTPFISKYFHKGDSIIVTGELQTRIWTDDNGKKRKSYIVNVAKAYFGLDGKASKPNTQAAQSVSPAEIEAPGELPFEQ